MTSVREVKPNAIKSCALVRPMIQHSLLAMVGGMHVDQTRGLGVYVSQGRRFLPRSSWKKKKFLVSFVDRRAYFFLGSGKFDWAGISLKIQVEEDPELTLTLRGLMRTLHPRHFNA
jgi:hypothetical protein